MVVDAAVPAAVAEGKRVDAFAELFEREYPQLAGFCWNLVGDRETAADLAQEAFARLYARWIGVREPRAYLYRVVTNLAYREWRNRPGEAQDWPDRPGGDGTRALAVRIAVAALPPAYRSVVWLHYFAGLPVNEVATILGRKAGTVKWQLSEARTRLARTLEDDHA